MSYVEDNLMPNEKILFTVKFSQAYYISPIISFIFSFIILAISIKLLQSANIAIQIFGALLSYLFLFLLIYTVFLTIRAFVIIRTSEFAVTTRRVISKTGFIKRRSSEILLTKIESVGVDQGVLGRFFNYGNIRITGTGGTNQRIKLISNPVPNRKKLIQVLEHIQSKMNSNND